MKPYTSDSNSLQYYSYIIKEQTIKFSGSKMSWNGSNFSGSKMSWNGSNFSGSKMSWNESKFLVVRCLEMDQIIW